MSRTVRDATTLTPAERRVLRQCTTPRLVQRWVRSLPYNRERGGETLRTFRGVVRDRTAHCLEGCLAAAMIVGVHGHPPLVLHLASQDGLEHSVALFRYQGRWGAVGKSRDEGLHGRAPVFATPEDLAWSYTAPYVDGEGRVVGWRVADLDTLLPRVNWRLDGRNRWAVDRALLRLRHHRLHMPERHYQEWLARYRAFREASPRATPAAWRRFYGAESQHWW
jgi:hypothetical protein